MQTDRQDNLVSLRLGLILAYQRRHLWLLPVERFDMQLLVRRGARGYLQLDVADVAVPDRVHGRGGGLGSLIAPSRPKG